MSEVKQTMPTSNEDIKRSTTAAPPTTDIAKASPSPAQEINGTLVIRLEADPVLALQNKELQITVIKGQIRDAGLGTA